MNNHYDLPHTGGPTLPAKLTGRLIQEMRQGCYADCERLPAEVDLAGHFGVSRSVIRDVLSNLEREGFISRGRGVGTLIQRDIVNLKSRIDLKYEYNHLVADAGGVPSTDSVKLYEKKADDTMAARLKIEPGEDLLVCEKRILASGVPVIYSVDSLPTRLFSHLDYRRLDWATPVFDLLEGHCGIAVDTDIAVYTPTNATPEIRQKLQVPEGEALMMVDEVGYYKFNRPILHACGYYTNYFDFTILRKKF